MVAASFQAAGVKAVHVDGDTDMDERKRIFVAFAKKEIDVLCFCDLLTFGFDLSQASGLDVCIESGSDLKPTKSLSAQLQWWGRLLRYMKDKTAIIIDHVNNWKDHGFPDDDREWSLQGKKKKKRGEVEEPKAPTRQCPECQCAHKVRPDCPQCGYVYPIDSREIEEVAGTLVKLSKEEAAKLKEAAKFARVNEIYNLKTLDELVNYARQKKYKSPMNWALRIFNSRQAKERAKHGNQRAV